MARCIAHDSSLNCLRNSISPRAQSLRTLATLRLFGVDGVDENQVPLPNRLVSHLQESELLQHGVPGLDDHAVRILGAEAEVLPGTRLSAATVADGEKAGMAVGKKEEG